MRRDGSASEDCIRLPFVLRYGLLIGEFTSSGTSGRGLQQVRGAALHMMWCPLAESRMQVPAGLTLGFRPWALYLIDQSDGTVEYAI